MTAAPVVPGPVTVRVPAKVNLELLVGPRRDDGYHGLSTVFHAVSLYDDVTVSVSDEWGVSVSGPLAAGVPEDGDNLAMRAARLVQGRFDVEPVHISIRKGIPVSGGMAGGSADAAATLVALDHLWALDLDREELEELGSEVGSDVPFLVAGGTAMGSGRGEMLAPVLARGTYHWVFALAEGGLSTPAVYARVRPAARQRRRARAGRHTRPDERAAQRRRARARAAAHQRPPGGRDLAAPRPRRGAVGRHGVRRAGWHRLRLRADHGLPRRGQRGRHRPRRGPHRERGGAATCGGPVARCTAPTSSTTGSTSGQPRLRRARLPRARHRTLLDEVSLGLDDGDRIGVVGPNGAGKSTLLRVLAGPQEPDAGRVTRAGGVAHRRCSTSATTWPGRHRPGRRARVRRRARVGHRLPHPRGAHRAARGDARGRHAAPSARSPAAQRRRVALAALLVRDDEVLVLDEPTNHLDVEGVAWLADHLVGGTPRRQGALVVVTHDRWFLDAVCTRTWEVHDGDGRPVRGRLRGLRAGAGRARAERVDHRGEARRTCCARSSPGCAAARRRARRSPSSASTRPNALIADEPPPRDQLALTRMATARLGKDVLDIEDASRRATATGCCSTTSPGGSAPATASASSASTAPARRRCCGCCPATCSRRRAGSSAARPCRRPSCRQDVEDLDELADLRVHRGHRGEAVGRRRRQGAHRGAARRAARVHRERAADPGAGPVRRRAPTAAAAAAARRRAQRAAARRADQRPRHRHARRPRGPARRLAGHADRRLARPLPARARLRHGRWPCSATACCASCPAASSSTCACAVRHSSGRRCRSRMPAARHPPRARRRAVAGSGCRRR